MSLPPLEPEPRARRIDTGSAIEMLSEVEQDIDEGMTHFAWRAQRSRVVAIAEHVSFATGYAIDGPREPNRESSHTPRERNLVVAFDDQVNVIRLHREVDYAKPFARGFHERTSNREKHELFS